MTNSEKFTPGKSILMEEWLLQGIRPRIRKAVKLLVSMLQNGPEYSSKIMKVARENELNHNDMREALDIISGGKIRRSTGKREVCWSIDSYGTEWWVMIEFLPMSQEHVEWCYELFTKTGMAESSDDKHLPDTMEYKVERDPGGDVCKITWVEPATEDLDAKGSNDVWEAIQRSRIGAIRDFKNWRLLCS